MIPLLIFAFGLVNCGRDLFGSKLDHYPGDLADTRFNNIILEHDYQWLIGNQPHIWDPPFFYPAKNMLAGSDNHFGTFFLYAPFRFLGFDEMRSFQFWVFCLFALNFFIFHKVARKLGLNTTASATGAFLFTFSMPVLGSVYHIQTLCKFSFPLVLFFFYRILFGEQKKNMLWFSLSLAHVFYSSLYYGIFTLLLLCIFFLAALFFKPAFRQIFAKQNIWWILGSVILLVLLLVPLLQPYMEQEKFSQVSSFEMLLPTIPHPYSYFMPHWGSFFYGFLYNAASRHTELSWGHAFFIGFVSLILIFTAAFFLLKQSKNKSFPNNRFFALCGITLFAGILLTSAAGPYSLYRYIMQMDAFAHLKVMNRVVLIELFFMGMLVAWSLNRIDLSSVKGKWALGILALLVCAEHWMHPGQMKLTDLEVARHHHDYVLKAIDEKGSDKKAFVVLANRERPPSDVNTQTDAMMAALQKQTPTLNGYTTVADPSYYNVYAGTRHSVNIWLNYCRLDTIREDQKILFIP